MPHGLVRSGNFNSGNPVPPTDPSFKSNLVTWAPSPAHFGTTGMSLTKNFGNAVTWLPSPAHFGNVIS